jgi:alpha-beta hydrolase superfamily lysophospholipase
MDVVDGMSSIAHLADRTKNHEDATEAEVRSDCSGTIAAGTTPAHESARQRRQREKEADKCPVLLLACEDDNLTDEEAHKGVGLPKVLRRSPATRFWGER